ncbi:hypothetical protein ON010_g8347 [Phytophthora cinnamomi]|nr:hypothetical protein ON010_g8347 [Phytophthora cinnamomi]
MTIGGSKFGPPQPLKLASYPTVAICGQSDPFAGAAQTGQPEPFKPKSARFQPPTAARPSVARESGVARCSRAWRLPLVRSRPPTRSRSPPGRGNVCGLVTYYDALAVVEEPRVILPTKTVRIGRQQPATADADEHGEQEQMEEEEQELEQEEQEQQLDEQEEEEEEAAEEQEEIDDGNQETSEVARWQASKPQSLQP